MSRLLIVCLLLLLLLILWCALPKPESYTVYPILNRSIWMKSIYKMDDTQNEIYGLYFADDMSRATLVTQVGGIVTDWRVKEMDDGQYDSSTGIGTFTDGTSFSAVVDSGSNAHLTFTTVVDGGPGWTNGMRLIRWNYPSYPGIPTTSPPPPTTTPPHPTTTSPPTPPPTADPN